MKLKELERSLYNKFFEPRFSPGILTGRESRVRLQNQLELSVLNESFASLPYMQDAQRSGAATIIKVRSLLPIYDCKVTLHLLKPRNGIEKSDPTVSGAMRNGNAVTVYLYSSSPSFEKQHNTQTQGTIAHELHHIERRRRVRSGKKLFHMLVDEGLAMVFAEDYFGDKFELPQFKDITDKDLEYYWNRAKRELFREAYYENWFGPFVPSAGLPDHLGYLLGYHLTRNYLKGHTNETSVSLVGITAEKFIE